jgi:hypothetical protein
MALYLSCPAIFWRCWRSKKMCHENLTVTSWIRSRILTIQIRRSVPFFTPEIPIFRGLTCHYEACSLRKFCAPHSQQCLCVESLHLLISFKIWWPCKSMKSKNNSRKQPTSVLHFQKFQKNRCQPQQVFLANSIHVIPRAVYIWDDD